MGRMNFADDAARLRADPRTQQVSSDPVVRAMLKKREGELLALLASHEVVRHVLVSMGTDPGLAVITGSRLLYLGVVPGDGVRTVDSPWWVRVARKGVLGTKAEVTDARGNKVMLHLLKAADLDVLQAAATDEPVRRASSPPRGHAAPPPGPAPRPKARATGAGPNGSWQWSRPVYSWQDAEQLAADHMSALGFQGVTRTLAGSDGGIDVVAEGAAAQVKFHTNPTGSPDIQRLRGAADAFGKRLFYATAYSSSALAAAGQLGIAAYQYTPAGLVVPLNPSAHDYTVVNPAPPPERTAWGSLTFESRQNRAARWAQQIQEATGAPISDRRRKGARQLAEREAALKQLLQALEVLADTDNPLYKRGRRERTLAEAERQLKLAARTLRIILR